MVGVWERMVWDGAFGGGHVITINVCFGRTLGIKKREWALGIKTHYK